MQKEKVNLNWHTYTDHIKEILGELKSDGTFADVTLVTDDKKSIRAHRNILSACSSVFKDILKLHAENNQTVIFLRGVKQSEIEAILEFIYYGEATFYRENVNELLLVAKDLNIRGLGKHVEDADFSNGDPIKDISDKVKSVIEKFKETNDMKQEIDHGHNSEVEVMKYECQKCDAHFTEEGNLLKHNEYVHQFKYECYACDKHYADKGNLKRHIEAIHEGFKYECSMCNKEYSDHTCLKRHIQSKHKGLKYDCDQCCKQFTSRGALKKQFRTVHEGVKYVCNQCENQFNTKFTLRKHQIRRGHEGFEMVVDGFDKIVEATIQ